MSDYCFPIKYFLENTIPFSICRTTGNKCLYQDGATPHCTDRNLNYLSNQFGGRLISRRSQAFGGRDWAPRSPDLNPLDYGIWGILKAKVYSPRPRTLFELRQRIDQEVAALGADQALLRRVVVSILRRS